jgi:hypothetical protein
MVCPRVAPSRTGASESQRDAPTKLTPRGGRRSDRLPSANSSMVPTAPTRTSCRGVGHGRGRQTRCRHRACRRWWIPAPPRGACSHYLFGAAEPRMFMFPSSLAGARINPGCSRGRRINPRAVGGAQRRHRDGGSKWSSPRVGGLQSCSPRAGLIGPPNEEVTGALQDVSSRAQSLHHELFDLSCLLTLILSSLRYADIGVLSLTPLKRLALSAWVLPSEPRPQPLCTEPLSVQVEEGLAVATLVE